MAGAARDGRPGSPRGPHRGSAPWRFGAALAIAVLAKIVVLLVALAIVAILFTVFFAGVVAIH